nr:hypothetical protein [uncultured Actinoplanes sp.]
MQLRRTALAAAVTVALVVPAVWSVSSAEANPSSPAASASHGKPTAKPVKKVKFSASGTVKAVDAAARTVTIAVKGGTKDVRGRTVTVKVPSDVKVVVNGGRRGLAEVAPGFTVTVTGVRAGDVYSAEKVDARGKVKSTPKPSTPKPSTPAPQPTRTSGHGGDDATPRPSRSSGHGGDDVTPEPSESPEPDETPEPWETPSPDDTPMPDDTPAPDETPAF